MGPLDPVTHGGSGAEGPEVHTFTGRKFEDVGTYLYGRRMHETMVLHQQPDVPPHILEYGEIRRAANKVVFSTMPQEVERAVARSCPAFRPLPRDPAPSRSLVCPVL